MSSHADPSIRPTMPMADLESRKRSLRRSGIVMLAPVAVYAVASHLAASGTLALAIAGAIPVLYTVGLAIGQRRLDPVAVLSAAGSQSPASCRSSPAVARWAP